ncbi:TadE/TadG family protein [Erythrobacter sp. EC-HK427]|uniref:TadE/TadG family protein n=1 Tax=Erythrobacter sp. EC-HK427 TaxID=2038396 RepID=UPI00125A8DF3|nr:TadE/TadG family type IV pilus assembly protein [Erythrobacter sp. EC-HK427]VVT16738.1 conserved hypothetical protein [Erythrobacter sp. EC-HK427]
MSQKTSLSPAPRTGWLTHLAKDTSGNVIAILAFALFPMLALIGGGVDMGRGYLAQSRLQQACDAATLAARKRLGTRVAVDGVVPSDVVETGNRFFNLNFQDGAYGTENRQFNMALENDYSVTGTASVDVPTTLMALFNFNTLPVSVTCGSIQSFSNLDIMMVIDTTGSMRHTNAGDSLSRIDSVREVIRSFYDQIEASKAPETRIRYGFVPYASNVNVGHLLEDDWVVDNWTYQSRRDTGVLLPAVGLSYTYFTNYMYVSGTRSPNVEVSSYAATWYPPVGDEAGYYRCEGTQPANTRIYDYVIDDSSATLSLQASPPAVITTKDGVATANGTEYWTQRDGDTCRVWSYTDTNYVENFDSITVLPSLERPVWQYRPIARDVSNWRTETEGCIEERDTYVITDYDNVDFTRALDLDIDLVPTAGNPATQWRPRYRNDIYVRSMMHDGTGSFTTSNVTTADEYVDSGNWWFSNCPAPAQKLQEMTGTELDAYLDTLVPDSATYHDIGMIWGGRLLSPTGLFASDNADTASMQMSRHLIWLTDGQTEPYDLAYGAYGVDGLDQRRWLPGGSETLAANIEARFGVACEQVKNRDIVVWVIAFGTTLNPIMEECAGPGRSFQASNASELSDAFQEIAGAMSELRVAR